MIKEVERDDHPISDEAMDRAAREFYLAPYEGAERDDMAHLWDDGKATTAAYERHAGFARAAIARLRAAGIQVGGSTPTPPGPQVDLDAVIRDWSQIEAIWRYAREFRVVSILVEGEQMRRHERLINDVVPALVGEVRQLRGEQP